ncbi:MAG: GNAT family N-acetyltransferase [Methanoregulaceae archaeon]|jgi:nucleotide-binding universal stress UspA family protein/N-acetylglutamate synthase-like GNAT family acetyltransferase|nr:GNAT family N-acetyltransferase [Methanoregulaceae archaeon]MCU0629425.1 GNAT family N-acetyltransferase [Methanoregulaceae archaeon]
MSHLILLPTDFSEYACMTANMVPDLPGAKKVILLHVTESAHAASRPFLGGHEVTSPKESAERSLNEEKKRFLSWGIPVRTRILQADGRDIQGLILTCARKEGVDLIMLGARGKGFVEGLFLGSVSSQILRHATTHVLITHHHGSFVSRQKTEFAGTSQKNLFTKVLYPVDFSKPSRQGLDLISGQEDIDELVLLHVIPNVENRKELDQAIRDAYAQLQELGRIYEKGRTKVRLLLRFGRPAEMICDMAIQEKATLIMLPRFGASDFIKSLPIGSTAEEVAIRAKIPVYLLYPDIQLEVEARELEKDEFPLVEEVWLRYHQQTADRSTDRIFGVFVEGMLVAVARCRRHPDGLEVDGVFTLDDFRGRGYARDVMEPLVAACGKDELYMHSTISLVKFYEQFGFVVIHENELPPTIKARFDFAVGEMEGSNVQPMRRGADPL